MEQEEQERMAFWKQWAMSQAVVLCAANTVTPEQLETTAERIYRWTAFPPKAET